MSKKIKGKIEDAAEIVEDVVDTVENALDSDDADSDAVKSTASETDSAESVDSDLIDDSDAQELTEEIPENDAPEPHLHDEVEHEERSSSFAGRMLTYLLLLIAGGALALWGGPKVAPQLPPWAAPAAKYLTPGGDAALRDVAALRGEVDEKLSALSVGPDLAEMTGIAETVATGTTRAAVSNLETRLMAEIGALDDTVGALRDTVTATDSGEIESRLGQMEARLEGVSAELSSLSTTVSEAALSGGKISPEALASLTANAGKIDGLKAELSVISQKNGALSQRIDEVEAAANRKVEEAAVEVQSIEERAAEAAAQAEIHATEAAVQKALQEQFSALDAAVKSGAGFDTELAAFAEISGTDIPENLNAAASTGILSLANLKSAYAPLAHRAIRDSIKADAKEEGGALGKVTAFFQSQVATRSLAPSEGDSTDAVLSRMEAALEQDNLEQLLVEAEALTGAAQSVLTDWLSSVTARKSVLTAVASLGASAS